MSKLIKKLCVVLLLVTLILPTSFLKVSAAPKSSDSIGIQRIKIADVLVERVSIQYYDQATQTWIDGGIWSETYDTITFANSYTTHRIVTYSLPYIGDGLERRMIETFTYTTW